MRKAIVSLAGICLRIVKLGLWRIDKLVPPPANAQEGTPFEMVERKKKLGIRCNLGGGRFSEECGIGARTLDFGRVDPVRKPKDLQNRGQDVNGA
jgi:hypothetical protein